MKRTLDLSCEILACFLFLLRAAGIIILLQCTNKEKRRMDVKGGGQEDNPWCYPIKTCISERMLENLKKAAVYNLRTSDYIVSTTKNSLFKSILGPLWKCCCWGLLNAAVLDAFISLLGHSAHLLLPRVQYRGDHRIFTTAVQFQRIFLTLLHFMDHS